MMVARAVPPSSAPDVRSLTQFKARFVAGGVDHGDFDRVLPRIENWGEWCRVWSEEASRHRALGEEAGRHAVSAGQAFARAAVYYHFAKYLFFQDPDQYLEALQNSADCYRLASPLLDPPVERIEVRRDGVVLPGVLRRPLGISRPPLVIVVPGLDATKEEMHTFLEVFVERGMAALSFDGPGQGEVGLQIPIQKNYGEILGLFLDKLGERDDLDLERVGIVGVSLGGYYAPQAAATEPRIKAAVAVCGPFNWGDCYAGLPPLTRAAYIHNSGAPDDETAERLAHELSLEGVAEHIQCPLLVIHAGRDRLIPPSEGERLADAVPGAQLVVLQDAVHVCHNFTYVYRPLVADWMADHLDTAVASSR